MISACTLRCCQFVTLDHSSVTCGRLRKPTVGSFYKRVIDNADFVRVKMAELSLRQNYEPSQSVPAGEIGGFSRFLTSSQYFSRFLTNSRESCTSFSRFLVVSRYFSLFLVREFPTDTASPLSNFARNGAFGHCGLAL
jgi:hypothetical protein